MQAAVAGLSDEEIVALARHYAALPLTGAQVTSLLDKLTQLATLPDATVLLDDLVVASD